MKAPEPSPIAQPAPETPPQADRPVTRSASVDAKTLREQAIEHPLVKDALELLGGKIVRVEPKAQRPTGDGQGASN